VRRCAAAAASHARSARALFDPNPCGTRAHCRSSDGEPEGPRPPRVVPVREPEPLNDFERARLENIRRNQEALAGAPPTLPGNNARAHPRRTRPPAPALAGLLPPRALASRVLTVAPRHTRSADGWRGGACAQAE
jgi:hypothetical protein